MSLPWRSREVIKLLKKSPRPNAKRFKTYKEQASRTGVGREESILSQKDGLNHCS